MSKKQITGIVVSLLLIVTLFSLPKVVVNSEDREESAVAQSPVITSQESPGMAASRADVPEAEGQADHEHQEGDHADHDHPPGMHGAALGAAELQIAGLLREKAKKSESIEKSAIFVDSLAVLFANAAAYDSAAFYAEEALELDKTFYRLYQAGAYNLEAFKLAIESQKQKRFAQKAEKFLLEVLEKDASHLDAKSKLGMIYVTSENPMKGIKMLQEVLDKDPDHTEALFNMGILSVQSGQYQKAAERFEHYTSLKPEDVQAQFYLAYSYLQLGRKAEAKKGFEKVKELDKSPDVLATVDEYLKDL